MIGKILDKVLKKEWSDKDVCQYVGQYRDAYLTYAVDNKIREKAASGGTTSALLIHGLENKLFDGAIVCNSVVENGKVRARFALARTAKEILAARGSKYVQTRFLKEVIPLIESFNGKVAVVGLPCDISLLKKMVAKKASLSGKVAVTMALVCGHNSRTELIDKVTSRIEKEAQSNIIDYRFRVGHWRGRLEADLANGKTVSKPTKIFNDYQNLFFFSEEKCMACFDHYGYAADISIGDVWLFRLKHDPIKRTGIITRTEAGQALFDATVSENKIMSESMDVRDIMDGQSRIGPSHYNLSARSQAGKLLGVNLKDKVNTTVSWHEWLNAFITIGNMKLSQTSLGKIMIFSLPRPLLKLYLYFKKGLESIK